jgi:ATP-dependent Clp protease ATP-binding subunit ClpA
MFKKIFLILPVVAMTMVLGNAANAAQQCSPQEVKGLENELKHLSQAVEQAKKDKNAKRRDHNVADLEKKGHYLDKHLEACKKNHEEVCRRELPKAENELKHIGERWLHSFMNPHAGNRKGDLRHLEDLGERVSRFLRMCKG